VALPALFVVFWSSGYVACKAAVQYAGSFTVLFLRCAVAISILLVIVTLRGARWPARAIEWAHLLVAGLLIHAIYLGINFHAAATGFPVGITALIGALQPLFTALLVGVTLGERVGVRQWLGLVLGLAGVLMVLSDRVAFDWSRPVQAGVVGLAMLSLTAGTLYQKRFCAFMDWRTGILIQMLPAFVIMLGLAAGVESFRITEPDARFVTSILWMAGMSSGLYGLLHFLFLRGAAASAASLLYLVPVLTSTMTWVFFDERLGPLALAGMALAVVGVALASLQRQAAAPATGGR
jgi:drug/metabolite transporter (DMT)-like permease